MAKRNDLGPDQGWFVDESDQLELVAADGVTVLMEADPTSIDIPIDVNFTGTVTGASSTTATQQVTLGAAATTFAISSNVVEVTGDAGANTIATITGGTDGQLMALKFVDALVTITDTEAATADTVNLDSAFTSAANTVLTLIYDGTKWFEVSRSVAPATFSGDLNGNDLTDSSDNVVAIPATDKLLVKETPGSHNAAPTLAFGDGDTGLYEGADDQLSFATAGVRRMYFTGSDLQGNLTNAPRIKMGTQASKTNPSICPAGGDLDTGLGWVNGGDGMYLVARSLAVGLVDVNGTGDPLSNMCGYVAHREFHTYSEFTDNGDNTGYHDFSRSIPAGAHIQRITIFNVTGFTGDTSATVQVGIAGDLNKYMTGTPSVFTNSAHGVDPGLPSGATFLTAAETPRVTITSATDFTNVSAGSFYITIFYFLTDPSGGGPE